jgi:hypothetical protein
MAVERRSMLSGGLGLAKSLPATLIFDYPTIEAIANYLLDLMESHKVDARPDVLQSELTDASEPTPSSDLTDLSDAEIEALLMKKLKDI